MSFCTGEDVPLYFAHALVFLPGVLPLAFFHVENFLSLSLRHHTFIKFPTWEMLLLFLQRTYYVLSFIFRCLTTSCCRQRVPLGHILFSSEPHYASLHLALGLAESNNSNEIVLGFDKEKR